MHNFYFIVSSPLAARRGLDYQEAERVWRDDENRIRFSRKYSVNVFIGDTVTKKGIILNGLKESLNGRHEGVYAEEFISGAHKDRCTNDDPSCFRGRTRGLSWKGLV